jgi:hypothetical protein
VVEEVPPKESAGLVGALVLLLTLPKLKPVEEVGAGLLGALGVIAEPPKMFGTLVAEAGCDSIISHIPFEAGASLAGVTLVVVG